MPSTHNAHAYTFKRFQLPLVEAALFSKLKPSESVRAGRGDRIRDRTLQSVFKSMANQISLLIIIRTHIEFSANNNNNNSTSCDQNTRYLVVSLTLLFYFPRSFSLFHSIYLIRTAYTDDGVCLCVM